MVCVNFCTRSEMFLNVKHMAPRWNILEIPRLINGKLNACSHSKGFTILSNIHPFMHTFITSWQSQPCKASGAVSGRRLAQEHLNTQLGGAGDQTSNLPVTSQPALPHDPHAARDGWLNISLPVLQCFPYMYSAAVVRCCWVVSATAKKIYK